ncbi:MAG: membrane protein insertase YidC [Cyclobacteriaceae bacterium]
MDRNQFIGLIVMMVLMTVYFKFFSPEMPEEPVSEADTTEQSEEQPAAIEAQSGSNQSVVSQESDSLLNAMNNEKYGVFAAFASQDENTFEIENEDIIATFSSKGGQIKRIVLKKHLTYLKEPLVLVDENSTDLDIWVKSNYRPINISDLQFTTSRTATKISSTDTLKFSFKMSLDNRRFIEQEYIVPGSGYTIGYNLKMSGLDGIVDNEDVQLNWVDRMKVFEDNLKDSRIKATINYQVAGEEMDYLSPSSTDTETEELNAPIDWLAFHHKFFTSAIIAENDFRSGSVSTEVNEADSTVVKTGAMNLTIPIGDIKAGDGKFSFYYGPNNYAIMKKVTDGFAENVDLGWKMFRFINKILIIPIFHFLENYMANYGIIIILMVIFIRILLSPLTYKSHMSMAKMKVLKPELDALKEKNEKAGGDAQKAQQEQMQLYSKVGINPLSGCIPMLLQMPILFAMFNFFPNSIELRQKAFLWAHDLSTYDSILDLPFNIPFYGDHVSLFTLLMCASTILYTWSNSQMNTAQMQGPMKSMQYMMPIMMLFFLNSYSSGLTFYYFVSNVVGFGQIALFRKFVDEDKILKKLEENRKKNANKKKSGFQQKLAEAMKTAEEKQKQKKKKGKR